MSTTITSLDVIDLTRQVREVYSDVAHDPRRGYHFELGRDLAERLGYRPDDLDRVPVGAVDSFAGVGNPVDMADMQDGERVLDLGSGSGMDIFYASLCVGPSGSVLVADASRRSGQRRFMTCSRWSCRFGFERQHLDQLCAAPPLEVVRRHHPAVHMDDEAAE